MRRARAHPPRSARSRRPRGLPHRSWGRAASRAAARASARGRRGKRVCASRARARAPTRAGSPAPPRGDPRTGSRARRCRRRPRPRRARAPASPAPPSGRSPAPCSRDAQDADEVLAAAARAGVVRELLLELLEQRADLRLLDLDVWEDTRGRALDDFAVRSEQLLELLPEVKAHREVAVPVPFGEDAGACNLERLPRPVA